MPMPARYPTTTLREPYRSPAAASLLIAREPIITDSIVPRNWAASLPITTDPADEFSEDLAAPNPIATSPPNPSLPAYLPITIGLCAPKPNPPPESSPIATEPLP